MLVYEIGIHDLCQALGVSLRRRQSESKEPEICHPENWETRATTRSFLSGRAKKADYRIREKLWIGIERCTGR